MLLAPDVEKTAVAEGDVLGGIDAEGGGGSIDPVARAFEFGEVADRGFVDDAVAFAQGQFGAPFLVTEGGDEADGEEDLDEGFAVGDFGFGFDAMLVGILARAQVGKTLVSEDAATGVVADAENFSAGAQLAAGGVVEDVGLEAAGSLQGESGGLETMGEAGKIVDAEFDFGFDGHDERQLPASSCQLLAALLWRRV